MSMSVNIYIGKSSSTIYLYRSQQIRPGHIRAVNETYREYRNIGPVAPRFVGRISGNCFYPWEWTAALLSSIYKANHLLHGSPSLDN